MSAVCVALIDKDNSPLVVRCGSGASVGEVEATVYSSLDMVEEKLGAPARPAATDLKELYLGLLLSTEDHKVYGYVSNTKLKFILVTEIGAGAIKDQEVRAIFKRLHNVIIATVSNPFYVPGTSIHSKNLDKIITDILAVKAK